MIVIIEGTVYKLGYKWYLQLKEFIEKNSDGSNEGDSKIQSYIDNNKPLWKEIGVVSLDWRL